MNDDAELLRRYAEEGAEDAFAEVVRRHVDLVYGVALRQTRGNAGWAEEVVQAVFTDLARKAPAVARHESVVGWLHTATRFTVAKALRTERRRRAREQEVFAMNERLRETEVAADWERLRPVIDEALGELKERERAAILLRFFERRPLAEVGATLALTETAARSCVDRALDKLHTALARRGISSTSAALGVALSGQGVGAAPAGLAASVALAALAGGPVTAGLIFMTMTKLKFLLVVGTAMVMAVTAFVVQQRENDRRQTALREEAARLQQQVVALRVEVRENASLRAENTRLIDVIARSAAVPLGASPSVAPSSSAPLDQKGMKSREQWRNTGRATPTEAYETVMWASDRGDIDLLVEAFVLSEAQRAEAEAVFKRFSHEVRVKYGTPERMMAMLFSSGTPARMQPLAETPKGADDVVVRTRVWNDRGESNELELAFHRYSDGWRVVIPEWHMNKSLARLRK